MNYINMSAEIQKYREIYKDKPEMIDTLNSVALNSFNYGQSEGIRDGIEQGKADILKELTKYSYENHLFLSASYQVEKTGKYDNGYPHFFLREKHLLKWIAEQRKGEK